MGSVPMPVCPPQVMAKLAYLADVVGDDGGGDFVHLEAAVGFGNIDAAQAQFPGFLQQIAGDGEIFVLHLLDVGHDFVDREFFRGLQR